MNNVPVGSETIQTLRPASWARRARASHFSALCLAALLGAFSPSRASAADPADAGPGDVADANFRPYVALLRADMRSGKARIFNETMKLSNEEAKVFWPIYQDYETEFFALGDRRLALIHQFADVYNKKTLDNPTAKALTKDWLKQQE